MTAQGGWFTAQSENGTHVLPLEDCGQHALVDCPCRPREDDGVIIHNSFDGREAFERGERKPS